jgi:cytochrome c2
MELRSFVVIAGILASTVPVYANGNSAAGRDLVEKSCTTCHASSNAPATATDAAPALSQIARDNQSNKTWIHAWLSNPHKAMTGIMLSRQQIDDVIAYLDTLPTGQNRS